MRKTLLTSTVLIALFSCKDNVKLSNTWSKSSQLFYKGDLITTTSDKPVYAEGIVEQNGKIVFVGSKADAETKYAEAIKIDLKGKTVLPGFIDPHSHFGMVSNTMGQVALNPKPVGNVTNPY